MRIGVLEAEDVAVVGVAWPLPPGLASGPLHKAPTVPESLGQSMIFLATVPARVPEGSIYYYTCIVGPS